MPAEPAVYRGLNMTLEELRTKDDEELMRLNMDGNITDNEYFLATEAYRDLYLAWLHGRRLPMKQRRILSLSVILLRRLCLTGLV